MKQEEKSQFFALFDAEAAHQRFSSLSLRKKGLDAFSKLGLPDRKHEEFRYSSLMGLAKKTNLELIWPDETLGAEQKSEIASYVKSHSKPGDINAVLVDGALVLELCDLKAIKAAGISIEAKTDFSRDRDDFGDGILALNQAFFQGGLFIQVAANNDATSKIPLNIFHFFAKSKAGSGLRFLANKISVGPRGRLALNEYFCSLLKQPAEDFISHMTEVELSREALFEHFRMEMLGASELSFFPRVDVLQQKASSCRGFVVSDGAKLARSSYEIKQVGEDASTEFFGLAMVNSDRKLCLQTRVLHLARRGKSNQYVKSVVGDSGRFSFLGSVKVDQAARGCDARKLNRNLVLSKKAEVDSRPVLEIDTQDVKCSHGSTTAPLNKDEIFYFLSRGIDAKNARRLLCTGFLSELTSRLDDVLLKTLVNEQILTKEF